MAMGSISIGTWDPMDEAMDPNEFHLERNPIEILSILIKES